MNCIFERCTICPIDTHLQPNQFPKNAKQTLKLTNETCHFPIGNSLSELLPFTKKTHGTSARNEVEVERIEIESFDKVCRVGGPPEFWSGFVCAGINKRKGKESFTVRSHCLSYNFGVACAVIEASPNLETISPSIPRIPFELV